MSWKATQRFIRGRIVQGVVEGHQWIPISGGRLRGDGAYYLSGEKMATFLSQVLQPSWGSVMQHFCCSIKKPKSNNNNYSRPHITERVSESRYGHFRSLKGVNERKISYTKFISQPSRPVSAKPAHSNFFARCYVTNVSYVIHTLIVTSDHYYKIIRSKEYVPPL